MRRVLHALALAGALTCSGAALAEEEEPAEAHGGISNWWSWDYGAGAKDPAHKHLPPPFGYALVNFAIFAAVMYKLAARPLRTFVSERHDRIRKDLDEAGKLRKQAEAQLAEYQKKVQNVDAEIDALLATISAEAEAEKARIVAAAEAQAGKLKLDAQKQIEAEIARARMELRDGVIEAAIAAAEQIIRQQIGADDQRKMAELYVASVEEVTVKSGAKPGRPA